MTMTPPEASAPRPAERPKPSKPLPNPEHKALTAPFWEAAKRHELAMQRCKNCARLIWYPREQCPHCFSQNLDWTQISGRGYVYAFTIIYQPQHPAFEPECPYALAVIHLNEGIRMVSNIVDCALEDVRVDMPVEAVWDDVTSDWTLVRFKPS